MPGEPFACSEHSISTGGGDLRFFFGNAELGEEETHLD
jgi:hypothetical protein